LFGWVLVGGWFFKAETFGKNQHRCKNGQQSSRAEKKR